MFYPYYFGGMHLVWWFLWVLLLLWIFATPYDLPGQRRKKDSPLDILKKRLAAGEITLGEYQAMKSILDHDQ